MFRALFQGNAPGGDRPARVPSVRGTTPFVSHVLAAILVTTGIAGSFSPRAAAAETDPREVVRFLSPPSPAPEGRRVAVRGLVVERFSDRVRVRVRASGPLDVLPSRIAYPPMLILDLPAAVDRLPESPLPVHFGRLVRIRHSQYRIDPIPTVRLVFDLRRGPDRYHVRSRGRRGPIVVEFPGRFPASPDSGVDPGRPEGYRLDITPDRPARLRAGSDTPLPLRVRLRTRGGRPLAGETVTLRATPRRGALIRSGDGEARGEPGGRIRLALTTDRAGRARVRYRPGTRSGPVAIRVRGPARRLADTVVVRVLPRPPLRLHRVGGNDQRALIGRTLKRPMVVQVRDRYGNPVPGEPVRFESPSGGTLLDVRTDVPGVQAVGVTDERGRVEVDRFRVSPTVGRNVVIARRVGGEGTPAHAVRFAHRAQPPLLSVRFRRANLPDVLRSLARAVGWNLVLPDVVDDRSLRDMTVSVRLERVPAPRALDTILELKGLSRVVRGNVVRIVDQQNAPARQRVTEVVALRYRRAASVVSTLREMGTDEGTAGTMEGVNLAPDPSTNSIVFTAPRSSRRSVRRLIERLDSRQKQVLIRGLILEYALEEGEEINPEFFVNPRGDRVTGAGEFTDGGGLAFDAVDAALDRFGPGTFTALLRQADFQAVLNVLASRTRSNVLARPQITAINGERASIRVGSEQEVVVSRQTSEGLQTSLETIEAFTELNVTPTITRDGHVRLDLRIASDDFITDEVPEDVITQINRRRTENSVRVRDGEVLVLGGLIEESDRRTTRGIPYLRDLPLLGGLFRTRSAYDRKSELLVFLTPYVLRSDTEARSVSRRAVDETRGLERPPGLEPPASSSGDPDPRPGTAN